MKSLGQFIVKKKTSAPRELDEKTILFVVGQVIKQNYGEVGSTRVRAHSFRSGNLILSTESSAWREEIWLHREELATSINRELGHEVIAMVKI